MPVPATDLIYIKSVYSIDRSDFIIHDIQGRIVLAGVLSLKNTIGKVDISHLASGCYTITFSSLLEVQQRTKIVIIK